MLNSLVRFPLHPLFIALYAVLAILANNIFDARVQSAGRALILSAILAMVLCAVTYLLRRQLHTACTVASVLLAGFFSYGHLYDWGRQLSPMASEIVRHRFLLPTFVALVALSVLYLWGRPQISRALTPALNLAGLALVIMPIASVVRGELEVQRLSSVRDDSQDSCRLSISAGKETRDVYYLVFDEYARADVLAESYAIDNGEFISALERRGFFVADGSQSNYANTGMSLASSLNMDYLPLEGQSWQESENDYWTGIADNEVRRQLACVGYSVVGFDSGYDWSTWEDADVFLSPIQGREGTALSAGLNAFEALLVYSSLLRVAVDASIALPEVLIPDLGAPMERHRQRILFTLEVLEGSVFELRAPKFVFAHVIAPHRPFVFGPEGEARGAGEIFTLIEQPDQDQVSETVAYTDQIQYINGRILRAVDEILASYPAGQEPIIVLQADHGPDISQEGRMRIFNAYYLPAEGSNNLYESISPVNTFRVIFNTHFGADYELLPDVSCYSRYDSLRDFRAIPNPQAEDLDLATAVEICG